MVLTVRAIKPSRQPVAENVADLVARELGPTAFAGEMVRTMANYPPQQATVSGYRRTGGLGRGWRMTRLVRGQTRIYSEVQNRVWYAGYVQGLKRGAIGVTQTREMRRRGWLSVSDGVRRVWPKYRRNIVRILTQRDPRVRARRKRMR